MRRLDQHSTLSACWSGYADTGEGKMNVVHRTVVAEVDCIIALRQAFRIFDWNSLPGLAAIRRDIVITARARALRHPGLERGSYDGVGILRIDRDGNFRRIDGLGIAHPDHMLGEGAAERKDRNDKGSED